MCIYVACSAFNHQGAASALSSISYSDMGDKEYGQSSLLHVLWVIPGLVT